MHIVRYLVTGAPDPRVGIITDGDSIAEIPASGGDLGSLLLLDSPGLQLVASTALAYHTLSDIQLLPPIRRPGKILALAGNYHPTDVRKEVNLEIETPEFFIKPSTALLGPNEVIPFNDLVEHMVEEIELGVVIGKPGKNIAKANAFEHVFGYTIVNDFSARKLRFSPDRANPDRKGWYDWLNGKWLDGYCPMGPWIVDSAALDISGLELKTVVNGEVRIQSDTSRMIYDVPTQIEYISRLCTLEPGDVISSGVAVGPAESDEIYANPGDVIEGTVDGIGTLRNTLGKPA